MKKCALGLILGLTAGPAFADPLTDAIKAAGGIACFTRSYDAMWLKAHRGQTVREVKLALSDPDKSGSALMRLHVVTSEGPLYSYGGCYWDAAIGAQNASFDPTFKPTEGVYCHMVTDIIGGSAVEGPEFPIDWGDGQTIQLHLEQGLVGWTSYDIRRTSVGRNLKPADRIVRLNRSLPSACQTLVAKFAPGLE